MPGGKPTMFMAILMFGAPGAEILYPDPGFPIYRSMIEYTGATPVPVPIREENGFAFSAEETLKLITPQTRLLILNSPANPTGGVTGKVEVSPESVMIMPGGKPTMFMSILMFGEPGADILYPDPGFPIYRSMIEFTGARPVPVPIREENAFGFSAEETLSLITPQTRLLILNSPANPTGGVTPKAEVDKLVAGLERHPHVAVMSDEIYDHMVYDGEQHVCLLSYPSIRDRLILLNGWSKTYAMTGWRLGYAVWPGKLYDYARKLAVNLHSCVNASAQYAGLAALQGPQDEVRKMVMEFDRRRKIVIDGLNNLPGVSCATPKGAFYAFPNIKRTGWKAKPLASSLLEDAGVAIIGGPDFGILGEGYVRLSYANSTENILKALERMGEFLVSRKAA